LSVSRVELDGSFTSMSFASAFTPLTLLATRSADHLSA